MNKKKILLVEDDSGIQELIFDYLTGEGYEISIVEEKKSIFKLKKDIPRYSLALIDLMLPDGTGFEVIKEIRKSSTIPIIIITAKNSEEDKAMGFAMGADDYVLKPFSILELSARIKANLRRVEQYDVNKNILEDSVIVYRDIKIDTITHNVTKSGEILNLTYTEFEILKLLLEHQGRAYSKKQIYELVWKEPYYGNENVLNSHMNRLRSKLRTNQESDKGEYIKTLWGIGYKMEGIQ